MDKLFEAKLFDGALGDFVVAVACLLLEEGVLLALDIHLALVLAAQLAPPGEIGAFLCASGDLDLLGADAETSPLEARLGSLDESTSVCRFLLDEAVEADEEL